MKDCFDKLIYSIGDIVNKDTHLSSALKLSAAKVKLLPVLKKKVVI